jgi:PHP family Zn ribbon phosphoesterase
VTVLIESSITEINKIAGKEVSMAVEAFRTGEVKVIPGGGGEYGRVVLPGKGKPIKEKEPPKRKRRGQKNLFEY